MSRIGQNDKQMMVLMAAALVAADSNQSPRGTRRRPGFGNNNCPQCDQGGRRNDPFNQQGQQGNQNQQMGQFMQMFQQMVGAFTNLMKQLGNCPSCNQGFEGMFGGGMQGGGQFIS